jgi:hypothetical protein
LLATRVLPNAAFEVEEKTQIAPLAKDEVGFADAISSMPF